MYKGKTSKCLFVEDCTTCVIDVSDRGWFKRVHDLCQANNCPTDDVFLVLVCYGLICGISWILAGIVAIIAGIKMSRKLAIGSGIFFTIFFIVFTILFGLSSTMIEKVEDECINLTCETYAKEIKRSYYEYLAYSICALVTILLSMVITFVISYMMNPDLPDKPEVPDGIPMALRPMNSLTSNDSMQKISDKKETNTKDASEKEFRKNSTRNKSEEQVKTKHHKVSKKKKHSQLDNELNNESPKPVTISTPWELAEEGPCELADKPKKSSKKKSSKKNQSTTYGLTSEQEPYSSPKRKHKHHKDSPKRVELVNEPNNYSVPVIDDEPDYESQINKKSPKHKHGSSKSPKGRISTVPVEDY